jgi:hypothetical protein
MPENLSAFLENPITKVVVTLVIGLFFSSLFLDFFRRSIRIITVGYRTAILGLPRAGKTALVAAMFSEIFADPRKELNPVGPETINRVNQFIEMLDSGRPIPPTKEKDAFIFRFVYYVRRLLVSKIRYEGEIVDFPGEMSKRLLDSAADGTLQDDIGLFGREFYSWILSSRAVIFVIDSAGYTFAKDKRAFVARMTAEIRATWQLLQQEGPQSFRPGSKRVALVFTKVDIARIWYQGEGQENDHTETAHHLAFERPFGTEQGSEIQPTEEEYAAFSEKLEDEFEDLISFFGARERNFETFFVSAYFKDQGRRIGIRDLLRFILPTRAAIEEGNIISQA